MKLSTAMVLGSLLALVGVTVSHLLVNSEKRRVAANTFKVGFLPVT